MFFSIDAGAGKKVMAGLIFKELEYRRTRRRTSRWTGTASPPASSFTGGRGKSKPLIGQNRIGEVLDGIEAAEFDRLVNQFVERQDPNAISFQALDEAARERLDEVTTTRVELTGTVRDDQITFDPPSDAPILVRGNELVIGGLHLVVKLRREAAS